MVSDFASIEVRCLFWLVGETEALQQLAGGADIYSAFASRIYGTPVSKKTAPEKRHFGKEAILGLGYKMGGPKFFLTCQRNGLEFTEEQARDIVGDKYSQILSKIYMPERYDGLPEYAMVLMEYVVDLYRTSYPGVSNFWTDIEKTAIRAVKEGRPYGGSFVSGKVSFDLTDVSLRCRLPSGRFIYYPKPRVVPHKYREGKFQLKHCTPSEGFKEVTTQGGQLVENVTQAVARDLLRDAKLNLRGTIYNTVLSVHDEIVAEVPEGEGSVEDFTQHMQAMKPWAEGLPVLAETERMKRYRK